jgi:hypothetical protein
MSITKEELRKDFLKAFPNGVSKFLDGRLVGDEYEDCTDEIVSWLYSKPDGRTIKKYNPEKEMPVGVLSLLFSLNDKKWRNIYKEGRSYEIINTKSNRKLGTIIFYLDKRILK